ncbi:MAG TPA: Gfo/Idh/MocA family oxidoreductase [Saprospiraceae bacterium]|nr:Gfo/Idh/MocA family oxidoreductase [Saprospiraceae bacterium]
MNKNTDHLSIGIIGAGGFAFFAAKAFLKVRGITISFVADIDPDLAAHFAKEVNAQACSEEQLYDSQVDLVYIATPPYVHYSQSKKALEAGKHVICEKPAALHTSEAEELAGYAADHDLLYTVNLMQRYNPLYNAVTHIIQEKWLGEFVHGYFENYASDEKLTPDHWFWEREKSGGIFIEHGVHFFDMFEGWFGKGNLLHSFEISRNEKVVDKVQAVVLYGNSPVNFYHGFNQPKLLDRQEMRLQFDRGDITLYEWVPVMIRMHGLFTSSQLENLYSVFPGASIEILSEHAELQKVTGKFFEIGFNIKATITSGNLDDKMDRYEQLVISMITDQWDWIKDRNHIRVIDQTNAVESLRIAEEATVKAEHL